MYKQVVIYVNTTSIFKPKGYMNHSMGLGSTPLLHGPLLRTLHQNKMPASFFCCKWHRY